MSHHEVNRILCAANVSRVEDPERLLRRSRQPNTEDRQAVSTEHRAQERESLQRSMGMKLEDTHYAVAHNIVSEDVPATFENRSVAPLTDNKILVQDAITAIFFQVKKC